MSTRGKHAQARPRGRRLRSVALLSAAAVAVSAAASVLLGSELTSASFQDSSSLNISGTGVGNPEAFDIALVADGVLRQADGEGLRWTIDGSDMLVPGSVLTTVVPVVANGPYDALVRMSVEDVYDETIDGGLDPFGLLRWTVVDDETGEVLAGSENPLLSAVDGASLGQVMEPVWLAARGSVALGDGDTWTEGAPGSIRLLRVSIAYPDTPESERFNGGSSQMRLVFDAESA